MRTGAVAAFSAQALRKGGAHVYGFVGLGNTAQCLAMYKQFVQVLLTFNINISSLPDEVYLLCTHIFLASALFLDHFHINRDVNGNSLDVHI